MTDYTSIIERLEKATGPDRELDAIIRVTVIKGAFPDETLEQRLEYSRKYGAHYTESIDAALTLAPDGYTAVIEALSVDALKLRGHRGVATLYQGSQLSQTKHLGDEARGATPAIALCIAALRARGTHAQETP